MKNDWFKIIIVYVMWAVFVGLGLLVLIVSRSSGLDLLRQYYVQDSIQRRNEVAFFGQAYFFVAGIILLILTIVIEEYFKNGVRKNILTRRMARVFGFEILALFIASFATAYLIGFSILVTAALIVLLIISGLLLWFGYKNSPAPLHAQI